jgi:PQ loop repeat.
MVNSLLQGLGFAGSIIFLVAYAPQIIHLIRIKDSTGISIWSWSVWFVGGLFLVVYAYYLGDPVFIFMTVLEAIALFIVLALALFYRFKK